MFCLFLHFPLQPHSSFSHQSWRKSQKKYCWCMLDSTLLWNVCFPSRWITQQHNHKIQSSKTLWSKKITLKFLCKISLKLNTNSLKCHLISCGFICISLRLFNWRFVCCLFLSLFTYEFVWQPEPERECLENSLCRNNINNIVVIYVHRTEYGKTSENIKITINDECELVLILFVCLILI